MANCFLCSSYLPKGEGVRAKVVTGEKSGRSYPFLGLGRFYTTTLKALRTICPKCAEKIEAKNKKNRQWWINVCVTILFSLIAFLLLLFLWNLIFVDNKNAGFVTKAKNVSK